MNTTKYRKALKVAHNELREELDSAESEAERAYVRGKRAGILQAIAELTEHDDVPAPSSSIIADASGTDHTFVPQDELPTQAEQHPFDVRDGDSDE